MVIDAIRRLLGLGSRRPDDAGEDAGEPPGDAPTEAADAAHPLDGAAAVRPGLETDAQPAGEPSAAVCPSCGYEIVPAPARNRRCPACREPVVVRRLDGRPVYLTEAAVEIFDAERQREAEEAARDVARQGWLRLATAIGVPAARVEKLAAAPPTEATVDAARKLYVSAAEARARTAKHEKQWIELSRIRRTQAAALYAEAGSPVPPPEDIAALHREGMLAVLRSFGAAKAAELVGAGCCPACRADDGRVFKLAEELRTPRLPHEGCTKGLCACDWWIGTVERQRRRRRKPTSA